MLVKITSKNQITIPKKLVEKFKGVQYLDVQYQEGALILKPVKTYETDLESIRAKMKKLGLSPDTVQEAVDWARSK
jgi:bifunctional DNA-binding transcriptional regulator/antitoxin component of YhaV-PrlF toxin-antitoxin module